MKVVLIGVGQAGGKITQALSEFDYEAGFGAVKGALAVNTAETDLRTLDVETHLIGQDRVKGHGVGGDNELGAEIMRESATEVTEALGAKLTSRTEAIVIVAGLGGGTGSGGAPALAGELRRIHDVPVYVLGALPGRDEGGLYHANAGRSLKTCTREADSVLLVDNDAYRSGGDSLEAGFDRINDAIAQRIGLLLAAGEATEGVAESVVDSSEIINTLRSGGISAVGYAAAPAAESADENVSTITSVTRNALLTGTSLPESVDAASALLVVAGRPDQLSRKGVERARSWLEQETGSMEVRGGDFPLDSDRVAALVLLSGLEGSPRVEELMERAREADRNQPAESDHSDLQSDALDDLI